MAAIQRLVILGLALPASALAFDGVRSEYSANRSIVNASRITAAEAISQAGASARAVGSVDLIGPGGRSVAAEAAATFSRRAAIAAGVRAASFVAPPVAVAWTAWEVYDHFRAVPDGSGEAMHDTGQDTQTFTQYCTAYWNLSGAPGCATIPSQRWCAENSAALAVSIKASVLANACTGAFRTRLVISPSCSETACSYTIQQTFNIAANPVSWGNVGGGGASAVGSVEGCPAYTDAWTGVFHPTAPVGFDGKCPTGSYTEPMTAQELADAADVADFVAGLDYAQMLRDAANLGPVTIPAAPDGDFEITNPQPQPLKIDGPVTTTTAPDGTQTEETVTYHWIPDTTVRNRGSWDTTTTTTTTPPGGEPGTPTTVTQPGVDSEGNPTPDPKDPCTANPDRAGCAKLGEVEDIELEAEDRNVEFEPDEGFGDFDGECPAPPTLALSFGSFVMDNTLLCDWLGYVRLLVIALAGLAAGRIFIGGLPS